jgi:hypothetical protein
MHRPARGQASEIRGDPPPACVLPDRRSRERAGQGQRHVFRSDAPAAGRPHTADGRAQHVWRDAMPGVRRLASTGRRPDVMRDQPPPHPATVPNATKARRPAGAPHPSVRFHQCARARALQRLSCCCQLIAPCYCKEIEAEILRLGAARPYAERTPRYCCAGAHGTELRDDSIWRRSVLRARSVSYSVTGDLMRLVWTSCMCPVPTT